MSGERAPKYDLTEIPARVRSGAFRVTRAAQDSAALLELDVDDIRDCVLALRLWDFYKSMESRQVPGTWQDVYRTRFRKLDLYVKLQISFDGEAVVISFKEL